MRRLQSDTAAGELHLFCTVVLPECSTIGLISSFVVAHAHSDRLFWCQNTLQCFSEEHLFVYAHSAAIRIRFFFPHAMYARVTPMTMPLSPSDTPHPPSPEEVSADRELHRQRGRERGQLPQRPDEQRLLHGRWRGRRHLPGQCQQCRESTEAKGTSV